MAVYTFFMPEAHKEGELTKGHFCSELVSLKKNLKNRIIILCIDSYGCV